MSKVKKVVRKKVSQPLTREIRIPGPTELNIPPTDLHDYTILLMGAKGIGKTTASSTFPGNLNFMWEPRRKNVKLRMIGSDEGIIVRPAADIMDGAPDPWEIFKLYVAEAVTDPTVNTITFDTVDLTYQACFESVCARLGVEHPKEITNDYGNSWNIIKNEFTALLDTIRASGKVGLLLISHVKERDQEYAEGVGKLSIIGPSCSPACIQVLKASCEFWFYMGWNEGHRHLYVRDPDRIIDVATGYGFLDSQGNPINDFPLPDDPTKFYSAVQDKFNGKTSTTLKKKVIKKKVR